MGRRLYVGNLPYSATEEQLTELFSRAGKVDNVRVMRDMATGRLSLAYPPSWLPGNSRGARRFRQAHDRVRE